MFSAEDHMLFN